MRCQCHKIADYKLDSVLNSVDLGISLGHLDLCFVNVYGDDWLKEKFASFAGECELDAVASSTAEGIDYHVRPASLRVMRCYLLWCHRVPRL
jgi:hypothetical protein